MSDKIKSDKNPIIPGRGVCDPHIHIFREKAYLYASHDATPGNTNYCMHDWQIWSSSDLVTWQLENVIHPEDFYMGESEKCWAVDCAERNGKYYYYFSDGNMRTGVGVGNDPKGPFEDVLGRPLLDGTVTTTREYDPAVFQDDDGEYYLVFGGPKWCYGDGCGYFIAKLNEDMVSLAETPRYIELDHMGDDKASLNKFNGKYYLSYGGFYAISDCVYGPYKYIGNTGASIDHTSYFEWHSQLFNAITSEDSYGFYRSSGICYVHIRDNGELVTDPLIVEYGVGKYDSDWNRIEAEWFMSGENITKVENKDYSGFSVVCNQKAVLTYPNIRNLKDKIGIVFAGGCVGTGCSIELHTENEDGPLLGQVHFNGRHREYAWKYIKKMWIEFQEQLPEETDICIVINPEVDSKFVFDYFHFFKKPISNP